VAVDIFLFSSCPFSTFLGLLPPFFYGFIIGHSCGSRGHSTPWNNSSLFARRSSSIAIPEKFSFQCARNVRDIGISSQHRVDPFTKCISSLFYMAEIVVSTHMKMEDGEVVVFNLIIYNSVIVLST
jgi:hypothetical protein